MAEVAGVVLVGVSGFSGVLRVLRIWLSGLELRGRTYQDHVHVVDGTGLDHHCFRPEAPVGVYVGLAFGARGLGVD